MGKLPKRTKKWTKSKVKKSSKKKMKSIPLNESNEDAGALEIKSEEIESENEIQALNETDHDILSLQLISRKIMKVNFIQALDKARRKSRRYLNKMKDNGSPEDFEEAKASLDEATAEKQDASTWIHPSEAVKKLSEILKYQKQNQVEDCSIQITKKFINDSEESL